MMLIFLSVSFTLLSREILDLHILVGGDSVSKEILKGLDEV
jgi:hypothetical protein